MVEEEAEEEEEGEVALEVEVNRMDFVVESSLCDSEALSGHQDASRTIQVQAHFSKAEVDSVQATTVHLFREVSQPRLQKSEKLSGKLTSRTGVSPSIVVPVLTVSTLLAMERIIGIVSRRRRTRISPFESTNIGRRRW